MEESRPKSAASGRGGRRSGRGCPARGLRLRFGCWGSSCRRLGKQDVDAEEVHGENWVDDLEALLVHQRAETFVGGDKALRLLFGDGVELRGEKSMRRSSFSRKLARAWGERSLDARRRSEGFSLAVIEKLLSLRRSPPAPQEHLLGDDLVPLYFARLRCGSGRGATSSFGQPDGCG